LFSYSLIKSNLVEFLWFWFEASWLVGSSGFVATFVDIDTLVVRKVVSTSLFESSNIFPAVNVTSHLDLVDVILLRRKIVTITVFRSVDFFITVGASDESWVSFGEAPVFVGFLAETFNDPVKSVTGEFLIITAAGFFTLLPRDQVVNVRHGVFSTVEEVFFAGFVVPTRRPGLLPVFHEVPSLAPFVFF
jgi:hypothetical protein